MAQCRCGSSNGLTAEHKKILTAMAGMGEPAACKDIAEAVGMESKSVACKLTSLKNKGYIESPVRCKYAITTDGKAAL